MATTDLGTMPESTTGQQDKQIPQAHIYILQGDDELAIKDFLKSLAAQIKAEMQTEVEIDYLDGSVIQTAAVSQSLNSLSLLNPRRLVVLDKALELLDGKESQTWLGDAFNQLPQSTIFVLVVQDNQRYSKGQMVWQKINPKHWLRKCLADSGKKTAWLEKPLPSQRDMPSWIMKEVEKQGGKFDQRAAVELANLVGNNLFQARHEISKAISYVGPQGTVTRESIRLLCSQSREEDIFAMVDAVGTRNSREALSLLQRLLRDLPAQYIFTMLARQVRILLMAREVLDSRGNQNDLVERAHLHAFVARKAMAQCRQFSTEELLSLYQQLDRMDEDSKTGNVTLEVAMETLIADLSRKK